MVATQQQLSQSRRDAAALLALHSQRDWSKRHKRYSNGTSHDLMSMQMFDNACLTACIAIGHPRKCSERGVKDAINLWQLENLLMVMPGSQNWYTVQPIHDKQHTLMMAIPNSQDQRTVQPVHDKLVTLPMAIPDFAKHRCSYS